MAVRPARPLHAGPNGGDARSGLRKAYPQTAKNLRCIHTKVRCGGPPPALAGYASPVLGDVHHHSALLGRVSNEAEFVQLLNLLQQAYGGKLTDAITHVVD